MSEFAEEGLWEWYKLFASIFLISLLFLSWFLKIYEIWFFKLFILNWLFGELSDLLGVRF